MARTNNLTNFLTDVSSAIKQKTGDNTPIPASEFDTEILSIETGGNYQSKTLNVTQNGNYNLLPDQEFDAISNVNISVSVSPVLQDKTITENGSYTADQNYDGLGTVIVNVPSQQINNQDKTITENGVYTADSGYTGLGTVTVNVSGGGSSDVKLFNTVQEMNADPNPEEDGLAVVYEQGYFAFGENRQSDTFYIPRKIQYSEPIEDTAYGIFSSESGDIQINVQVSSDYAGLDIRNETTGETTNYYYELIDNEYVLSEESSSEGAIPEGNDMIEIILPQSVKYTLEDAYNIVLDKIMLYYEGYFGGFFQYKNNAYVVAPTDLTLDINTLKRNVIGYGKDGKITGTKLFAEIFSQKPVSNKHYHIGDLGVNLYMGAKNLDIIQEPFSVSYCNLGLWKTVYTSWIYDVDVGTRDGKYISSETKLVDGTQYCYVYLAQDARTERELFCTYTCIYGETSSDTKWVADFSDDYKLFSPETTFDTVYTTNNSWDLTYPMFMDYGQLFNGVTTFANNNNEYVEFVDNSDVTVYHNFVNSGEYMTYDKDLHYDLSVADTDVVKQYFEDLSFDKLYFNIVYTSNEIHYVVLYDNDYTYYANLYAQSDNSISIGYNSSDELECRRVRFNKNMNYIATEQLDASHIPDTDIQLFANYSNTDVFGCVCTPNTETINTYIYFGENFSNSTEIVYGNYTGPKFVNYAPGLTDITANKLIGGENELVAYGKNGVVKSDGSWVNGISPRQKMSILYPVDNLYIGDYVVVKNTPYSVSISNDVCDGNAIFFGKNVNFDNTGETINETVACMKNNWTYIPDSSSPTAYITSDGKTILAHYNSGTGIRTFYGDGWTCQYNRTTGYDSMMCITTDKIVIIESKIESNKLSGTIYSINVSTGEMSTANTFNVSVQSSIRYKDKSQIAFINGKLYMAFPTITSTTAKVYLLTINNDDLSYTTTTLNINYSYTSSYYYMASSSSIAYDPNTSELFVLSSFYTNNSSATMKKNAIIHILKNDSLTNTHIFNITGKYLSGLSANLSRSYTVFNHIGTTIVYANAMKFDTSDLSYTTTLTNEEKKLPIRCSVDDVTLTSDRLTDSGRRYFIIYNGADIYKVYWPSTSCVGFEYQSGDNAHDIYNATINSNLSARKNLDGSFTVVGPSSVGTLYKLDTSNIKYTLYPYMTRGYDNEYDTSTYENCYLSTTEL